MKTSVIILFAAWLFTAFLWQKQEQRNNFLVEEIENRDSINRINRHTIDSIIKVNENYSDQFNRLLESVRKRK